MASLSVACFVPLPVSTLAAEPRVLLKAARHWVAVARAGRSPRAPLGALLGQSAPRFCLLMDTIVGIWQDPFTTLPPCADSISPDEYCLLAMLAHGESGDELKFHSSLEEMLPEPARLRLWRYSAGFMADFIGYSVLLQSDQRSRS